MSFRNFIVTDIAVQQFRKNRVFETEFAKQFPGTTVLSTLKKVAANNDWGIMTGDVFLTRRPDFKRSVCLSYEASPELTKILQLGVEPGLLISGESPNVAWSFYHNLSKLSKKFRHAYLFRGVADKVDSSTKFHAHYWPTAPRNPEIGPCFSDRLLISMVSSFKERFGYNRRRVASRIIMPLRWSTILWYRLIDSSARFPDLYKVRLDAVQAFAPKDAFCLFGRDWDVAQKYVKSIRDLNFANRPGPCDDKIATLSSFRFTLVFENCIFPGYVTEKIFDAMYAGTVPVYLGAPDIQDFVPSECFVDFRNYIGFDDLWADLESWSESRWHSSIEAINRFLASDQFTPFREETVAGNWFEWLTEVK